MRPPNKSRSRNKSNRRNNNNNNGGNALNRVYDSAGPDGRVRGTPVQVIEKYQALAHDHSLAGDRVAMENFQQHAEHYIRMINDVQRQIAERREQMENQNRGNPEEKNAQRTGQPNHGNKRPKSEMPADLSEADQPDVIDPSVIPEMKVAKAPVEPIAAPSADVDDASVLVETPEGSAVTASAEKAKPKPRRQRRPKPPVEKSAEEATPPTE